MGGTRDVSEEKRGALPGVPRVSWNSPAWTIWVFWERLRPPLLLWPWKNIKTATLDPVFFNKPTANYFNQHEMCLVFYQDALDLCLFIFILFYFMILFYFILFYVRKSLFHIGSFTDGRWDCVETSGVPKYRCAYFRFVQPFHLLAFSFHCFLY